jgi:hypothetical protein
LDSTTSISRWKLARMARRAPSSSVPGSVMRRSRSFWYSRMPLAKMRSIGPAFLAFCTAGVQVVQAGARPELALEVVVERLDALEREQLAEDGRPAGDRHASSSSMTSCTTQLACSTRWRMDRSWFMGSVPEGCGDSRGRSVVASTQPMRMRAFAQHWRVMRACCTIVRMRGLFL